MSQSRSADPFSLLEQSFNDTSFLKAHKTLPRRKDESHILFPVAAPVKTSATFFDDETETQPSSGGASPLGSPALLSGKDSGLPPTPPSNNSEEDPDRPDFSPPPFADGVMSELISKKPSLSTPTNQRSPPTPDPSPPRTAESLSIPDRPDLPHYPSSRAESFRTAREGWSDDGSSHIGERPSYSSLRRDEDSPGLQFEYEDNIPTPTERHPYGEYVPLKDLNTSRNNSVVGDLLTPTQEDAVQYGAEEDFTKEFDHIPNREWDTNLMRNVTVRRRNNRASKTPPQQPNSMNGVNGIQASPKSSKQRYSSAPAQLDGTQESPMTPTAEKFTRDIGWPHEVNTILNSQMRDIDPKRLSTASTTSTVVEAVVMMTSPMRRRTLRHTSKNLDLRSVTDSPFTDRSPATRSNRTSLNSDEIPHHRLVRRSRMSENRNRDSAGSEILASATSSVPSVPLKHHKDVIPVKINPVPEASPETPTTSPGNSPTKTHSLTRKRQLRPLTSSNGGKGYFDTKQKLQPARRVVTNPERAMPPSVPKKMKEPIQETFLQDPSEEPTPAHDPVPTPSPVPHFNNTVLPLSMISKPQGKRVFSAPEPRQTSISPRKSRSSSSGQRVPSPRTPTIQEPRKPSGENLEPGRTRRVSIDRSTIKTEEVPRPSLDQRTSDDMPRPMFDDYLRPDDRRISMDRSTTRSEEHAMARHLYAQSTPFSQFSAFSDTPDALEVSEATAVSIYPHNNHSLLVVQQVARSNTLTQRSVEGDGSNAEVVPDTAPFMDSPETFRTVRTHLEQSNYPEQPTLTFEPSTPPLQIIDNENLGVDSPLKNPRKPPIPPAVKVIPPTPAQELDRISLEIANAATASQARSRSPSRDVRPGPPARRLSLVQRARRYSDTFIAPILQRTTTLRRGSGMPHKPPSMNDREQESKLHPFWRPRGFWDDFSDSESDFDPEDDRLPEGGDTSDIGSDDEEEAERRGPPGRKSSLKIPKILRRPTNGFKGSGGFLIGNSLGVERHGTNNRRHYITVPSTWTRNRAAAGNSNGLSATYTTSHTTTHTVHTRTDPHSGRIVKTPSQPSLRSAASSSHRGSTRGSSIANASGNLGNSGAGKRRVVSLPGMSKVQIQYIGISGVRERMKERKAEKRRDALRKSIGSRYVVEGAY